MGYCWVFVVCEDGVVYDDCLGGRWVFVGCFDVGGWIGEVLGFCDFEFMLEWVVFSVGFFFRR